MLPNPPLLWLVEVANTLISLLRLHKGKTWTAILLHLLRTCSDSLTAAALSANIQLLSI